MERIIAAAYLLKPEYWCNKNITQKHPSLRILEDNSDDIYRIRIGRHHAEIIHIFGKEIVQNTSGFYTSYGRYVDRAEAGKIALAAGQCKKLHYWGGEKLDSSDIFDYQDEELV